MKIKHLIALVAMCLLGGGSVMAEYHGIKAVKMIQDDKVNTETLYIAEFGNYVISTGQGECLDTMYIDDWSRYSVYCYMKFTYREDLDAYLIQMVNKNGEAPVHSYMSYDYDEETCCLASLDEVQEMEESDDYRAFWYITKIVDSDKVKYRIENSFEDYKMGDATLYTQYRIYNPQAWYGTTGWETNNVSQYFEDRSCFLFQDNADMTQTIKDMPTGRYTITFNAMADGYYDPNGPRPTVRVNGNSINVEGWWWTTFSIDDVNVDEDGNLTVKFEVEGNDDKPYSYVLISNINIECQLYEERHTAMGRYGTICLPYDFEANGATLYDIADVEAGTGLITLINATNEGVAGKPYLYGAAADYQRFEETIDDNVASKPQTSTYLTGSFKTAKEGLLKVAQGDYVLQTLNNEQAFYKVTSDNIYCGTYKAYMKWTPAAGARAFLPFFNEEETAVNAINALMNGTAVIYDLNGNKQDALKKGINIVNGAKVLIK